MLQHKFIKAAERVSEVGMQQLVEDALPYLQAKRRKMGIWSINKQKSTDDSDAEEKSDIDQAGPSSRVRRMSAGQRLILKHLGPNASADDIRKFKASLLDDFDAEIERAQQQE